MSAQTGGQARPAPITIPSYGAGRLELQGATTQELEVLLGSLKAGHHWVRRGADGRIEHVPSYEPLPSPTQDEQMLPFWSPPDAGTPVQLKLFHHTKGAGYSRHSFPSITIQYLCGYGYSAENYRHQAGFLESYGFECLRSRRGLNGQCREIWFLPGVWAARGPLREAIASSGKKDEKSKTEVAVEFLKRNAQFGTLDVSVQRLAQVLD